LILFRVLVYFYMQRNVQKKVSNFMNGYFHRVFAHVYRKYNRQQKLSNGFKTVDIEGMKI